MNERARIIREWRESVMDTILTLVECENRLELWASWPDNPVDEEDFMAAFFRPLFEVGLGQWAGGNPAGGGLDALKAGVWGEELPTRPDLLTAIFGE